jgi:ABC-type oligopeptide transport system ATPase subunit
MNEQTTVVTSNSIKQCNESPYGEHIVNPVEVPVGRAVDHPLLVVEGLRVTFRQGFRQKRLVAVDNVGLKIEKGTTLGLVGESGSGKSTIGNAILGLVRPDAGRISLGGRDITHADAKARRALSDHVQVVFQDPYGSFNPSRTVGQALAEPLQTQRGLTKTDIGIAIGDMLTSVGLRPSDASLYPASFSGGQRQRIAVARALITRPDLVICDEAVSALDLSTQAQVLNLLKDLQNELGMALLFISHDLAVVQYMAQEIVVLFNGQVVERGDADRICKSPSDPYTQRLVGATLIPDPSLRQRLPMGH